MSEHVAGRLRFFLKFWETVTSDIYILNIISGLEIPFESLPVQGNFPPEIRCSASEKESIDQEVEKFLNKGIIHEVVPCEGQYISQIFPRPKKNGGVRIILNLSRLNLDVQYEHFKMETLQSVLLLMEKDCFMASLDLEDAYYSCNINEKYRKYLRFYWNEQLYEYTCLPNGLSCAPRIFTKILKPLYENLRSKGLISCYYLDDSWLFGNSYEECIANVKSTKHMLLQAGFLINQNKSIEIPSQEIEFLGFKLNSLQMVISLPPRKIDNIHGLCADFLAKNSIQIRVLAKFIGILVSSLPGVKYGELYYRFLERDRNFALRVSKGNYDDTTQLSSEAIGEIQWWSANASTPKEICTPPHDLCIAMDASSIGWGVHYNNQSSGGHWLLTESCSHINVLELKAILFGLKSFLNETVNRHIRIKSDNTTAVSYVNHLGGCKSIECHKVTREIWEWAIDRNNHLSAEFIAGKENTDADETSRIFDENTEWALPKHIFDEVEKFFQKFDIDLFASRLNAKVEQYAAWKPDPNAMFVDAFTSNWSKFSFYAFPPFSLILRTLRKVKQDHATGVLICPIWPTQAWFPLLMKMLVKSPLVLPPEILELPFKPSLKHKQNKKLRLMACHLSGNSSLVKDFQANLSISCVHHGDQAPRNSTRSISKSGYISVVNGKEIQCNFMKW